MGNLEIKTLNNYIDLNVVILPNKEISTKLIKWSKFIASKFKSDYILDTKKHLPHLSLYSARYPLKNRRLLVKAVNDIVKSVKLFS
ncbi:MAG: hypothetical protein M1409_02720 [Actinobacteria bacterium]|nr:hypothetical protein [Actinomycetota bacterium]